MKLNKILKVKDQGRLDGKSDATIMKFWKQFVNILC